MQTTKNGQGMLEGFDLFERRGKPAAREPFVSIQTRGNISMNQAAFEALGRPLAIQLLFHPGRRVIALKPASLNAPHAYPVRKQPNASSYLVAGQAFTVYHSIPTDRTHRYPAKPEGNVLLIDLEGEKVEVTSPRYQREQRATPSG